MKGSTEERLLDATDAGASEEAAPVAKLSRSLQLIVPMPLSAAIDEAVGLVEASPPRQSTFDIVLSGGGLAIYYSSACVAILGQLSRHGTIKVPRVYGVSCGAVSGACFLAVEAGAMPIEAIYRSYQVFMRGRWLLDSLRSWMDEAFPTDIHERATGRLFITVTDVGSASRRAVSTYPTRADLLDAIVGSATIPGLTSTAWLRPTRYPAAKWVDGVHPLVPSPTAAPCQLHVDHFRAAVRAGYAPWRLFLPIDWDFDILALRGTKDLVRVLAHGLSIRPSAIWLETSSRRATGRATATSKL